MLNYRKVNFLFYLYNYKLLKKNDLGIICNNNKLTLFFSKNIKNSRRRRFINKKNNYFFYFLLSKFWKNNSLKFYFMSNYASVFNAFFFFKLLKLLFVFNFSMPCFSFFLILYFYFLIYTSPNILFFFFLEFFKIYSYKMHNYFKRCLNFFLENTSFLDLDKFGIIGIYLKFKGKITGKAGDRKKVFYFRKGKTSITSSISKYEISQRQLHSRTGCTNCTILLLCK